ncbi:hypothetical protein D3C76_779930 [compost metagenome]
MKSVELQIAVPRTQEVGKVQNELQQRSTQEQTFLTNQQIKESHEMRHRSSNVDETTNSSIREEGKQQHSSQRQGQSHANQQEQTEHQPAEHPYKGHHIDLSL